MALTLFLKGGVVLIHDENDKVSPVKSDILVENGRISKIEPFIETPSGGEVLDCSNKIVSPGFIDTHHHVWESPLKGLFGDMTFIDYMGIIYIASHVFSAEDLFWASLAGNLEAIDAGTTTVLDHAHMNWYPGHSSQAIAATISSGIRSIFAYTPTLALTSTEPEIQFTAEPLADWVLGTLEQLAGTDPLRNPDSRVRLGLGFDWYFLPKQVVLDIFAKARSLGVDLVTSHYTRLRPTDRSLPELLDSYGLLDERIVLSHGGGATPSDARLLAAARAFVSATPVSELSMAVGPPCCFRDDLPGLEGASALGVDIHSATSSSIVNEMRVGLLAARGADSAAHSRAGTLQARVPHGVEEAFNLGTIQGARALGLDKDVGSIAVGKKADLVVFDALSPAMVGAAQVSPVMAIVLHSNVGDIDTVVVDGKIRKRGGKLLPIQKVEFDGVKAFKETAETIDWGQAAAKMLNVQAKFVSRLPQYDAKKVAETIRSKFGFP